ncbi:hypothetical protein BBJ28_00023767 [Nothophytophthora sp. Chile5]|nr:hypothetical protein BBJ28_00023767 [Nothophytophthora sp. Chile5]
MRGLLPDITGCKSLYPTIALQQLLSEHVTGEIMQRIVSHPLRAHVDRSEMTLGESYLTKSAEWMAHFGLIASESSLAVDEFVARLVWECRDDPSKALGIFWILKTLRQEFRHRAGDDIGLQLALFNMLLRVVGREKYHPSEAHGDALAPLRGHEKAWAKVSVLLELYQAKLDELGANAPQELRLRVALAEPLDGFVFYTLVENQIPLGLGTLQRDRIKRRLRRVGDRLRLMHNLLMHSKRFDELETIVRKCFRRVKWILMDSEV